MNKQDLSMFLCICALPCIVIIGYSIRYYFDNGDYLAMGISLALVAVLLLIAKRLYIDTRPHKPEEYIE